MLCLTLYGRGNACASHCVGRINACASHCTGGVIIVVFNQIK